ncbi:hypothetical protein [Ensifer aridi]|uniref:hypothetical protein n=1 Tax=Ensifer aridi TaxID=1708715 RepID=UPI000A0FFF28|nr:hypothetical protein [Ensifer aridi]
MTNNVRGIVTQEIGGKTRVFRLGANEWCELEAELGKSTGAIIADLQRVAGSGEIDFRLFRSMFRAALSYSDEELTLRDAGEVMSTMGLEEAGLLIARIVQAGMPEAKQASPGKRKRAAEAR